MAGAGGIRAGRAFVEIGALDVNLKKGLDKGLRELQAFGRGVGAVGKQVAGFGLALAAPLGLGVHAFGSFEDALAALKSTVNPTAQELEKITAAIAEISKATGVGPTKVTQAMVELLRAGIPLEKVLSDITTAALKFAKVAEIEVAEAATVLADAMAVFKVDATTAINTLSSAADASSSSLAQVVQAFSQVSAVAKLAGLSIEDTAAAIGILANAGVKGSDAGTSLKTFLLRLLAPADEGAKAIKQFNIELRQFVGGPLKPLSGLVEELQKRLGGLSQEARDNALRDIFGSDAIRAGAILLGKGAAGLKDFTGQMRASLTVAQKFEILMDTISGSVERTKAALERMGITVGGVLGPAIRKVIDVFSDLVSALNTVLKANPGIIATTAKSALEFVALGGALIAAGAALSAVGAALAVLSTPLGAIAGLLAAGGIAWLAWTADGQKAINDFLPLLKSMEDTAKKTFKGIADALKAGDLALAGKILWAGLRVEWLKGTDFLMNTWSDFIIFVKDAFQGLGFDLQRGWIKIKNNANEALHALIPEAPGAKQNRQAAGDRELANVDLAQAQQQNLNRRQAADDPAALQRERDLRAAQKELDDLFDQAKAEVPSAVKDTVTWTPGEKAAGPAVAKQIDKGVSAAARKVDVSGSFSAAALSGMGAGQSVSSKLEKQIEEAKKQTKELEKANEKLRKLGAKFV